MIYTRTMIQLQKEMQTRYDVTSTIRHKGEKGRNREHGFAMFLRDYLPEKYGIATGEIIPFKGAAPSPQCDIIIYDKLAFPVIGKSTLVQQVPYEGVYSVIEVKSQITASALKDSLAKFTAIRQLPRCKLKRPQKKNTSRNPEFLLFGYQLKTTHDACVDFMKHGINHDISLIALDAGFTAWIEKESGETIPLFLRGTDHRSSVFETLALSFAVYLDSLSHIDLGTPDYMNMLYDGAHEET